MSKEAMKLALGKIISARECHPNAVDALLFEAEEILEEALAEQPAQQEPVAWIVEDQSGERLEWVSDAHSCHGIPTFPLYTSPPAQKEPVTDEENEKFSRDVSGFKGADPEATKYALEEFLRNRVPAIGDIRALKHRIHALEGDVIGYKQLLDAAEQPAQQEPVAWFDPWTRNNVTTDYDAYGKHGIPLYTSPPQQEPVRIYDYVWPQRDEHKEECVYTCSYTPGHHLVRGELLAVVHPSQLKNAYLQRNDKAAHDNKENT